MQQIPNAGTYLGQLNGTIVVARAQSGAVCAYLPVKLLGETPWTGKHTITVFNKDGEPMLRSIDTLKEVFGWPGTDLNWFSSADLSEAQFELVCEHEEYTPENADGPVMTFKIKWLNPVGGGRGKMPEPLDPKVIAAECNAKLRALSGKPVATAKAAAKPAAKPVQTAAAEPEPETEPELPPAKAKASTPPPAKKAATPPPAKARTAAGQAPTATMEEAWAACAAANEGKTDDEIAEVWYSAQAEVTGVEKEQCKNECTIQQWGAIKAKF